MSSPRASEETVEQEPLQIDEQPPVDDPPEPSAPPPTPEVVPEPAPPDPPVVEEVSSAQPQEVLPEAKRRGRPTGAKNKPKIERVPVKKTVVQEPAAPKVAKQPAAAEEPVQRPPTPAPQLNLSELLRETLRKMQAERVEQQNNLYANLARSGLR